MLPTLHSLADIASVRENFEVECKLALGRDGQGALPEDVWETYSAFANTRGGYLLLGLRELEDGHFRLEGIPDPGRVIRAFLQALKNPRMVSHNLVNRSHIKVFTINQRRLIQIHIPEAPAWLKPVFVHDSQLSGSYRRYQSADMRMNADDVRHYLAHRPAPPRSPD